jgi:hypothetical protein
MIDFLSTITLSDKVINMMVDFWGGQGDQRGHRPRPLGITSMLFLEKVVKFG